MRDHGQTRAQMTRREALRAAARWLALGGLAGVAAALLGRRDGSGPDAHRCLNRGVCRGCAALAACVLPQALSARRDGRSPAAADGAAAGTRRTETAR